MEKILFIDNCKQCFPRPLDCISYLVCRHIDNKYVISSNGNIPSWCPLESRKKDDED